MCHTVCWILAPQRWIQPATPALGVWGLNHWTSREVPQLNFFNKGAWMLMGNYGHVGLREPQQPFPSPWSSTSKVLVIQSCPTFCNPTDRSPARFLCP